MGANVSLISSYLRPASVLLLAGSVLCGAVYPLVVTALAQAAFHHKAQGSLVERDGKIIGSELVGQAFTSDRYFWGRPSATAHNGAASGASNLGPSNTALVTAVQERMTALRQLDPGNDKPVPADLVLASASGLDPHISLRAAEYQIPRVARQRGMSEQQVRALVHKQTVKPALGVLGEPHVNVLKLNLALDGEAR